MLEIQKERYTGLSSLVAILTGEVVPAPFWRLKLLQVNTSAPSTISFVTPMVPSFRELRLENGANRRGDSRIGLR